MDKFFLGLTKVKCEAQGPFGKQLHNEKLHFVCSFFISWHGCGVKCERMRCLTNWDALTDWGWWNAVQCQVERDMLAGTAGEGEGTRQAARFRHSGNPGEPQETRTGNPGGTTTTTLCLLLLLRCTWWISKAAPPQSMAGFAIQRWEGEIGPKYN